MAEPSDNLFIADLPPNLDDNQLKSVFGAYGTILNSRMLEASANGKKAALIQFQSLEEAKWIVENLNGNIPQGLSEPVQVRYKENSKKGCAKGDQGDFKGGCKGDFKGGGKMGCGPYGGGGDSMPSWTPSWTPGGKGKGDGDAMDNLFVGDLPPDIDEAMLQSVFGPYGQIVSLKLLPQPGPNGKRCALLRFKTPEEAKWVVDNLNGNMPQGLSEPIKVSFKTAPGKGGFGGDKGGGCCGGPPPPGPTIPGQVSGSWGKAVGKGFGIKKLLDGIFASGAMPGGMKYTNDENALFVGGLPPDAKDIDLFLIFSPFGAIAPQGVRAMKDPESGSCKGFGFVNFLDNAAAATAMTTLNGTLMPDGKVLKVTSKKLDASLGKGMGPVIQ